MDEEKHRAAYLWPSIVIVMALLIAAISFFGSSSLVPTPTPSATDTPARQARIYIVTYKFGVFSPTNLRIHQGDTVRWHNAGTTAVRVVAQLQSGAYVPEFDSIGTINPDGYFSYLFPNVGTFAYVNAVNPKESGSIIVRP